ncbi:hypothetical protein ZWY2020_025805 [Hordeum vulgare]|nr:hypothetical protein ZWY2020_025805 [Hordeum vulgare]
MEARVAAGVTGDEESGLLPRARPPAAAAAGRRPSSSSASAPRRARRRSGRRWTGPWGCRWRTRRPRSALLPVGLRLPPLPLGHQLLLLLARPPLPRRLLAPRLRPHPPL